MVKLQLSMPLTQLEGTIYPCRAPAILVQIQMVLQEIISLILWNTSKDTCKGVINKISKILHLYLNDNPKALMVELNNLAKMWIWWETRENSGTLVAPESDKNSHSMNLTEQLIIIILDQLPLINSCHQDIIKENYKILGKADIIILIQIKS